MIYAKQRDANEGVIISALRGAGAVVQQLNEKGVPDLLVGYRGVTYLLEVKNPESKFSIRGGRRLKDRGTLRATQVKWFAAWKGSPVVEVINADEALGAIGAAPLTREQVVDALEAGAKERKAARLVRRAGRYF